MIRVVLFCCNIDLTYGFLELIEAKFGALFAKYILLKQSDSFLLISEDSDKLAVKLLFNDREALIYWLNLLFHILTHLQVDHKLIDFKNPLPIWKWYIIVVHPLALFDPIFQLLRSGSQLLRYFELRFCINLLRLLVLEFGFCPSPVRFILLYSSITWISTILLLHFLLYLSFWVRACSGRRAATRITSLFSFISRSLLLLFTEHLFKIYVERRLRALGFTLDIFGRFFLPLHDTCFWSFSHGIFLIFKFLFI